MRSKLRERLQTTLNNYHQYVGSKRDYSEERRRAILRAVNQLLKGESFIYWTFRCPKCGSDNLKKHQNQQRKIKGQTKRYRCRDCKHVFLDYTTNLKWTHLSVEAVGVIITQLTVGTTYSNTNRILSQLPTAHLTNMQKGISKKTVINVANKTADLLRRFESNVLKLEKSREWQIDEIFQKETKGKHFKIINVIDVDTRYLLASHVSESRGLNDALEALKKALNNTLEPPEILKCDGHEPYKKAAEKLMSGVKVLSVPKSEDFGHINVIEGIQNRMRGMISRRKSYRSIENLQNIADIFRLDHNIFFNREDSDKKPPVTYAGIELPKKITWGKIIQVANLVEEVKIIDWFI